MSNENFENKSYPDWDNVIIQLMQGDNGIANIRMQRQDIEAMMSLHGSDREEVIEMMFQALEEQVELENNSKEEK